MNPQYMTAGQPNPQHQFNQQNNNPPSNPLSNPLTYQSSLPPQQNLNNGPPNTNVPHFQNGPAFPPTPQFQHAPDLSQKLQGLNINPTYTNGSQPLPSPPQTNQSHFPLNANNQQFSPSLNQQRAPSSIKPPQFQNHGSQPGAPPQPNLSGLPQNLGGTPQNLRGPPTQFSTPGLPNVSQPSQPSPGALQGFAGQLPPPNLSGPPQGSNPNLTPQQNLPTQQPNLGAPPQPSLVGPPKNLGGAPHTNLSGPHQSLSGPQMPSIGGGPSQNSGGTHLDGLHQNVGCPPQPNLGGLQLPSLSNPPQSLRGPPQPNLNGPPQPSLGGPHQHLGAPLQPPFGGGPPQNLGGPPQPNLGGALPQPNQQRNAGPPQQQNFNRPIQQNPGLPPSQNPQGPHMPSPLNTLQPPLPGQQFTNPPNQAYIQPGFSPGPQSVQPGFPSGPHGADPIFTPGQYSPRPFPTQSFTGMPPMPGQQPSFPQQGGFQGQPSGYPPAAPGYPSGYPQQQQQESKRLDPDQMPSPIQVMLDDQNNSQRVFNTAERGRVPPLVTSDFIVDDQGNASPRFVRSSMYSVPVTPDMIKQTAIPFCLVLSPMADTIGQELPPPLLDFGSLTGNPALGPIRCQRCKAYMSTAMKFIDAGRHFRCAFCKANTEVPMEYTQYVNTMQQYGRVTAEMALGTYEVVATKEYCRNNTLPKPPALIFIIDVSYNAIKSGLVSLVCDNIKTILENLPADEDDVQPTRVGFITYSSTVQFYNIKGTLAQPQMLLVGDINDIFVPLLEGFLCTVKESGPIIETLAEQIPSLFADTRETETILLPAVQAGVEALKAADCCGRLLVFHTTLPSAQAPGKLINREDRKLLATEKEKQILAPSGTAYNELGQTCVSVGASVELFLMNNSYVDAATIGQLARLTGGGVNKYTYFQADIDGKRVLADICHIVGRRTAHDAVMRVRTSTGVRPTEFYGHFFMSNTTDIELASLDSDKAIAVEIKHDDKLTNEDGVYCQAALLYTHFTGQRRLRIINLSLNVATQLTEVYRSCEMDTIINFFAKQTIWKYRDWSGGPKGAREAFVARTARILACYRKDCASPSSAGQLVLPESMKLMPLYINCMLRSDAISGGSDISCDDRSCAMHHVLTADVPTTVVLFYPRLLPLNGLLASPAPKPQPIRCSIDKMLEDGVYLFENGVNILVWVGLRAPQELVQSLWGVPNLAAIESQVTDLPVLDNPASNSLHELINEIYAKRRRCLRVTLVKQRDKLEVVLRHFLVEDRGVDGSPSYVDFLCHMHKEIRALL